ncbi:MAG: helix-turn-helix transcriptional regulator [Proteobacteria bacterium]|nr:helix-turn-helix transcriptional regulator [Pseudomonadota bacterium]
MELVTIDKGYMPGNCVALWYNAQETFSSDLGAGSRFRLILVEGGTGILRLRERREPFIAPAVFCLNETDRPELEQRVDLQARAIYFHPNVINSALSFENMRGKKAQALSDTEQQDLYWMQPFLTRHSKYNGHLHIGPVSAQRIALLFDTLDQTLAEQGEWCWTCRARSFLLEILFLLGHVFFAPTEAEESTLSESSPDVDPVILCLHTHYQEKITISELSKLFLTNRTTLAEQFREATGMPVITYLIQLRIRLAAMMLRDTALAVSDIRERVGFQSDSHFGRMFRKYMEHSPTQYRERYCWVERHWWQPRQIVGDPWRSIRQNTSA